MHAELFIYELPISALTDQGGPIARLQGKRITSLPYIVHSGIYLKVLPSRLGAFCPSGDIRLRSSSSLSGMQFSEPSDLAGPWIPQHSPLYVWGPSTIDGHADVCIRIIDLSFSDPARLVPRRKGGSVVGPRMDNCTCRLHDEGWMLCFPTTSSLRLLFRSVMQAWSKGFGACWYLK